MWRAAIAIGVWTAVGGVALAQGGRQARVPAVEPKSDRCPDGASVDQEKIRSMVIAEAARQDPDGSAGIKDGKLALAVLEQESFAGRVQNSRAGARGPMQLMPDTADRYGVGDICDPQENIRGGVNYLKDLMAEYGGNIVLVAAAYNAGEQRVADAGGVPAIRETVQYVALVTNRFYAFDNTFKGGKRSRSARIALAREAAPAADRKEAGGLTWIGGTVLYIGENNNAEQN